MKPWLLRWLFNLWPPFLFAGIRLEKISPDWSHVRVRLKRHWYNRNYVGTHFGGSLFSMTDPFWMMMLIHQLGPRYHVWDQAGEIEFVRASRDPVWAEFRLDPAALPDIEAAAADGHKHLRWFPVDVRTVDGTLIARVRKQIYIRLKPQFRPDGAADAER